VKKTAAMAVVLGAALLAAGCGTSPGVFTYDETIPPDQSVLVVFGSGLAVLEYNGIDVNANWYPNDKWRVNKITLPAGEMTILFNYWVNIGRGNTSYHITGDDISLKYTFEPGKEYTVANYTKDHGFIFGKTEYGVAIWETASQTGSPGRVDGAVKSWKLGEL
jgi:hypothetical protein